jgi:subtilase family protein
MTKNDRTGYVLVRADEYRPGDIGRLNKILDHAKLGNPLGDPADGPPASQHAALISVPVHGGADPHEIEAAVRSVGRDGQGALAVFADRRSTAGTLVPGIFYTAFGKKSGHGMGWVPAPPDEMPQAPPWEPAGDHPVVAVLDSGVHPHGWLPDTGTPSFVVHAHGQGGWHSPLPPDNPGQRPYPPGTHWGHGTFIAGLIRKTAPRARVLSMRVMDNKGIVQDSHAVNALSWLARNGTFHADIVLMAFGRQASPDDPDLAPLRDAVKELIYKDVTVVASAGNNGSDKPVYPAAFATDLGRKMVSVGAALGVDTRAPYSNFGSWVTHGWLGTDIVSIHPQTMRQAGFHQTSPGDIDNPVEPVAEDSYAWWTGTSFAAAIAAGLLANKGEPGISPMPKKLEQP